MHVLVLRGGSRGDVGRQAVAQPGSDGSDRDDGICKPSKDSLRSSLRSESDTKIGEIVCGGVDGGEAIDALFASREC